MSTAKKKPTKSSKGPARKAATPKPAPVARKKPEKARPHREEARPAVERPAAPPPRTRSGASRTAAATKATAGVQVRGRLGAKWVCFKCNAKFYDLNKPEPLCPKCGANQNDRPKRDPRPKVAPEPVAVRPLPPDPEILPIDEDEEEALIMDDEEIDLGTADLEGEAEDFGEEEEEEPGDV